MIGGGAGFIADMIARIKANNAVKRAVFSRRKRFLYIHATSALNLRSRESTKEELEAIRKAIRDEHRKDRIRSLYAFLITLVIITGLFFGLRYVYREYRDYQTQKQNDTSR